jgi:hypothetical protein
MVMQGNNWGLQPYTLFKFHTTCAHPSLPVAAVFFDPAQYIPARAWRRNIVVDFSTSPTAIRALTADGISVVITAKLEYFLVSAPCPLPGGF